MQRAGGPTGRQGIFVSSPPPTPTRDLWNRTARPGSYLHLVVDAVHRGDQGDGDKAHHQSDEHDRDRLEETREVLDLVVELAVEVFGRALELLTEGAGLLPDLDHLAGGSRKELRCG